MRGCSFLLRGNTSVWHKLSSSPFYKEEYVEATLNEWRWKLKGEKYCCIFISTCWLSPVLFHLSDWSVRSKPRQERPRLREGAEKTEELHFYFCDSSFLSLLITTLFSPMAEKQQSEMEIAVKEFLWGFLSSLQHHVIFYAESYVNSCNWCMETDTDNWCGPGDVWPIAAVRITHGEGWMIRLKCGLSIIEFWLQTDFQVQK